MAFFASFANPALVQFILRDNLNPSVRGAGVLALSAKIVSQPSGGRPCMVTGFSLFNLILARPNRFELLTPLVRRIGNIVTCVNQFGSDALLEIYDIQTYAISVRLACCQAASVDQCGR